MQVLRDIQSLDHSRPIALVPTMGGLHAGHASLISRARELSEIVVVSVFVNPRQFENSSDFALYPRMPEVDIVFAEAAGASIVWMPEEENIYPHGFEVIPSPPMGENFEGSHRKGHFGGMLTAVMALFTAVHPRWALFGEKDFQQLFLVREMVQERHLGSEIVAIPTVRDKDGLALSSRNARLSTSDREAALIISKALYKANAKTSLPEAQYALVKTLSQEPRFTLDYAAIIDQDTFELAKPHTRHKRALVAGWVGEVRLIDNLAMTSVEQ